MKILITDYPDSLTENHEIKKRVFSQELPEAEVVIYPYDGDRPALLRQVSEADAILTAFLPIDREVLAHALRLKCVSIHATGYDNVDLAEAERRGVAVFAVGEYCTQDVAEHTMALILALSKHLKHYGNDIDRRGVWQFRTAAPSHRLSRMTLGIVGLGKIGKAVARYALAFGMRVIAYDPYAGGLDNVELVEKDALLREADVISNHMNLTAENHDFFTLREFSRMLRRPVFINVARGAAVREEDLVKALDLGYVSAAGLDVLADEIPKLAAHPLANRDNVIITPHAAFYTVEALELLERISCENIVYYLTGRKDKVFRLVTGA